MEHDERAHVECASDVQRIVAGAMAPVGTLRKLLHRVLRVMDEKIDSFDEIHHRVSDVEGSVNGLLMVWEIRDGTSLVLDAVTERRSDVRYEARCHRELTDREFTITDGVDIERAWKLGDIDGKHRRFDHVEKCDTCWTTILLRRCIDVHARSSVEYRWEERQPLHVIPVQVSQQGGTDERLSLSTQLMSEITHTSAEIENQRGLVTDTQRNA